MIKYFRHLLLPLLEDLQALSCRRYLDSIKKARQEYQNDKLFNHLQVFDES